jgi:hypothetical protein
MQALAPVMRGLMLSGKTDSVMDQAQGTVLRTETTWRAVHGIPKSHGRLAGGPSLTDKSSDRVTRRRRVTVAPRAPERQVDAICDREGHKKMGVSSTRRVARGDA